MGRGFRMGQEILSEASVGIGTTATDGSPELPCAAPIEGFEFSGARLRGGVPTKRMQLVAECAQGLDVRFWHLADIDADDEHVCFWG